MANIQVRVDDKLKAEVDALFADIGLDTSTAIRAFLRQSVICQGLPFPLKRQTPNAQTLAAILETERMESDPESFKSYTDVDQMMKNILK